MWDAHCKASHEDLRWRNERERFKRLGREAALAPPPPPPTATAAAASTASAALAPPVSQIVIRRSSSSRSCSRSNPRPAPREEFSMRKLLEKVTTVHPVEMSPPLGSGFSTALRHYQKQSLAFMVDVERSAGENDSERMRGGWLASEVGMGKVRRMSIISRVSFFCTDSYVAQPLCFAPAK